MGKAVEPYGGGQFHVYDKVTASSCDSKLQFGGACAGRGVVSAGPLGNGCRRQRGK